jgi:TetR/AcrR family transcriptional regulator, cholesterol catabolism regulator
MSAARQEPVAGWGRAGRPSPLATVLAALEAAHDRGELADAALAWSKARLSAEGRRTTSRVHAAERTDDIVRVAESVFLTRGYHHATIDEIGGEIGLTKAGVYHYFRSKQELLEAVCHRAMRAIEDAVEAGLAASTTPQARLYATLERYAEAYLRNQGVTVLMRHFDDVSPVFLATLRKRRKRIEGRLRRVLTEGDAADEFKVADAVVVAFGILGSLNWVHTWFEPSGRLSAIEVRDLLVWQASNSVSSTTGRRRAGREDD